MEEMINKINEEFSVIGGGVIVLLIMMTKLGIVFGFFVMFLYGSLHITVPSSISN